MVGIPFKYQFQLRYRTKLNRKSLLTTGMLCIWDVMKKCTAIAKKEIFYVVPFGPVAWLAGLVYINRVDPTSAYKQISQAAKIIDGLKVKSFYFLKDPEIFEFIQPFYPV